MNQNNQGVDISSRLRSYILWSEVFDDEEWMVLVIFLVNIHFGDYLLSFTDELTSFFISLIMYDISVGQEPLIFGPSLLIYLFHSQIVENVKVDGHQHLDQ